MSIDDVDADLDEILAGRLPPTVYRWDGTDPAPVVRRVVEAAGWRFAALDGGSKDAALRELAAELSFPEWFGHNLDALEECLAALDGRTLVLWEHWETLLEREPGTFETLLEVLGDRARQPAPFVVVLRVDRADP